MKIVSLFITAMILSWSAAAQTTSRAAESAAVQKLEQKKKTAKGKMVKKKELAAEQSNLTTLTDERSYKAKWTFEQMLARRLEIDAEEGERERARQKSVE